MGYLGDDECLTACEDDDGCVAADLARPDDSGNSHCFKFYGDPSTIRTECDTSSSTEKCYKKVADSSGEPATDEDEGEQEEEKHEEDAIEPPVPEVEPDSVHAEPAVTDGSYYLQDRDTGRCVHPSGGHADRNGVKLVWHDGCDGTRLQFRMLDAGDGYYYLQDHDSGRCVHPLNGHADHNGVNLVWWDGCDGTRLQFKLVGVPSLSASEEDASDDVVAHMTDELKAVGEETETEVAKEDKAEAEVDKKLLSETTHPDPMPVSESHPESATLPPTPPESLEDGLKSAEVKAEIDKVEETKGDSHSKYGRNCLTLKAYALEVAPYLEEKINEGSLLVLRPILLGLGAADDEDDTQSACIDKLEAIFKELDNDESIQLPESISRQMLVEIKKEMRDEEGFLIWGRLTNLDAGCLLTSDRRDCMFEAISRDGGQYVYVDANRVGWSGTPTTFQQIAVRAGKVVHRATLMQHYAIGATQITATSQPHHSGTEHFDSATVAAIFKWDGAI